MLRRSILAAALLAAPALALAQSGAGMAFEQAMQSMMDAMHIEMSGNPDRDFAAMMIPHHRGAIDMAKVELQYGVDPQLRALAEKVIEAQEAEIAELEAWLAAHPQ